MKMYIRFKKVEPGVLYKEQYHEIQSLYRTESRIGVKFQDGLFASYGLEDIELLNLDGDILVNNIKEII